MTSKILVIGDIRGHIQDVFKKVTALHSKNAFSVAIVVGSLFADPSTDISDHEGDIEAIIQGKVEIPLPTYFSLGKIALPDAVAEKIEANNGELCDNLYFLGKRTTIKTSEGLRIVALGGSLALEAGSGTSQDKFFPFYTEGDAKVLRGANSADILITAEWPAGIRKGSKASVSAEKDDPASRQEIADLCAALKPRYHFSTSPNSFFEREPFFHPPSEHSQDGYAITRFISLAAYGNLAKQKWIYAFSIDRNAAAPITLPPGTGASPFTSIPQKRAAPAESFSRFSSDTTSNHHHRRANKRQRQPPPGPQDCFFCLSNPNLAMHLVTSIGSDSYLTTAKGPLTMASTFDALPFPGHILIIPLAHTPTLALLADPASRLATATEMHRYRAALNTMLAHASRPPKHQPQSQSQSQSQPQSQPHPDQQLGSVTWEISRATGIHTHWQFVPVPADLIRRGLAEAAFKVEAQNEQYPVFETATEASADGPDADTDAGDFFRAWVWAPPLPAPMPTPTLPPRRPSPPTATGHGDDDDDDDDADATANANAAETTTLTLPLPAQFRFDLQFPRRVLAKLLRLDERMNWRLCGQTVEEETADADAFRRAFGEFDFTVE